jgi:iron complex transport system ATP-binding protein
MGSPLIQARAVSYAYPGPRQALERVDVDLCPGELAVVIGPNGSGKSTLVKVLAGLLHPSSGTVELEGRALSTLAPRERARRIAVVPQFLPALPEVHVADFVASGRYARIERWKSAGPQDKRAVEHALEVCDAADLGERGMTELSGGQRQRVLVARALAQEASVLLVDEPTNALDPEHQIRVFDVLAALRSSERAVLVVTHDLNLASQYATRLVLLDAGRVVAEGAPPDVLAPDVLAPVYGSHLFYGTWPAESGRRGPFVLPSRGAN